MAETSGRLLALLSLLQARRDWPGALLAARLGISPRTVRRDVDRLRGLGYRVRSTKGPDGGYRLDAGAELPPLLFDDDQAVAVALALQTVGDEVTGVRDAAERALATVRQVMPVRLRGRLDALEVTRVEPERDRARVDAADLVAIGAAVRGRETLRFDYDGGSDQGAVRPPRRAEPHHLVTWGGRWYVVGWDLDREDWRTYRVDRMTLRTPNGPRFAPRELPATDVGAFVSERFSTVAGGRRGEAILHASAETVAPWAGRDALVEAIDSSRCRVHASSWSWGGLAAWFAMFDVAFEIVEPPELRVAAAELAQRFAATSV
ncbi:MAG: helix-turn-helix transcriptional regulator [Cellulomonadaceae bacterium]